MTRGSERTTTVRPAEREHRRTARLATLAEVGRLITSRLSLDDLLRTTVAALADHLGYHTVAVMLIEPDDPETLVLRARGGVYDTDDLGGYQQSIHVGIAGEAARTGRRLLVNDVRADPRYIPVPGGESLRAELAIPLVVGGRVIGLLNVESEQPFSMDDAADIEIVAGQLAVAVENARLFAGTRAALDDVLLLYETSQRISLAATVDDVVQAYLEQVAARNRFICTVLLYEFDAAGRPASVVVRGRWTPAGGIVRAHQQMARSSDAFDTDLDAGRTVVIDDYRRDPRVSPAFRETLETRGSPPALAMIPLMTGGRRTGLVILSGPAGPGWTADDLSPYQVTAAQLGEAIESRRHQELLADQGRELAVYEERQRVARELHDAVIQSVFSAALIAQSVGPAWRRGVDEGERHVARLVEQSQTAVRELRALLAELRPAGPGVRAGSELTTWRPGSIVAALNALITPLTSAGVDARVDADGYRPDRPAREQALYRIAQEALANVAKHAHARHVTVRLTSTGDGVTLSITDDGRGFAPEAPVAETARGVWSGGLGLTSMHERAAALGGRVLVRSQPGAGTTVAVTLPAEGEHTP
jgi:signal transduction histidine kinase/putative methionine-R-sulfoxide reductase with GAF domain